MPTSQVPPQAEVEALFREISNWDRWGRDDERGTLNYITPEKTRSAAALVRSGRVVSLSVDVETVPSESSPQLRMMPRPILRIVPPSAPAFSASDILTIRGHTYTSTHLDALTHCSYDGHFWNGRPVHEAVTADGVQFGSIHVQKDGIATRGVLLDVARARGVERIEPDDVIVPADLDAAERLAGTRVTRGDAVIVRSNGRVPYTDKDLEVRTGLSADCARWFHAREVAVLGNDCPEKMPSGYDETLRVPFHQVVLVQMGLILIDHVETSRLALACAEEKRNEFFFFAAPLRIPKATGSGVNPLAIF